MLDPSSTLSYVTNYVAVQFGFCLENISSPFVVSTLVGEFIVAMRIYKGFIESVFHWEMVVDFVELDIVDFDIILRMD